MSSGASQCQHFGIKFCRRSRVANGCGQNPLLLGLAARTRSQAAHPGAGALLAPAERRAAGVRLRKQSNVIASAAWQPSCAGYITRIIDAPGYQLLVTAPVANGRSLPESGNERNYCTMMHPLYFRTVLGIRRSHL